MRLVAYEGSRDRRRRFTTRRCFAASATRRHNRAPRRGSGRKGASRAARGSACSAGRWGPRRSSCSRRRPRGMRRTDRNSSPLRPRPADRRSRSSPAPRKRVCPPWVCVSGFHAPDGLVGDMGGGSLELVEVTREKAGEGVTMPLGGLALQDMSGGSLKKAQKIIRSSLERAPEYLAHLHGRTFYAVGGTWRALARLHQAATDYPLHVMHAYTISPRESLDFLHLVEEADTKTLKDIESISKPDVPCLPTAQFCWRKSSGSANRRTLRSRPMAFAKACSTRSSTLRRKGSIRCFPRPRISTCCGHDHPRRRGIVGLDQPVDRLGGPSRDQSSGVCGMPPACWRISAGAPIRIIAANKAST